MGTEKEERMKITKFEIAISVMVIGVLVASFAIEAFVVQPQPAPKALDFTVSGSNPCLRFLNSSVSTVYVPLTAGAIKNWQLTISCTKMPGGDSGWTDVYIYSGYWDKGTDNKCTAQEVYPILGDIKSANAQITGNTTFTETFSETIAKSYTIFFIFPPGGPSTFQVSYKQI